MDHESRRIAQLKVTDLPDRGAGIVAEEFVSQFVYDDSWKRKPGNDESGDDHDLSILLQKSGKRESLPHFPGVRLSNGVVIKDSRVDFFQSTSDLAGLIPSHFRHTARPRLTVAVTWKRCPPPVGVERRSGKVQVNREIAAAIPSREASWSPAAWTQTVWRKSGKWYISSSALQNFFQAVCFWNGAFEVFV
jgi:hypothetical protein